MNVLQGFSLLPVDSEYKQLLKVKNKIVSLAKLVVDFSCEKPLPADTYERQFEEILRCEARPVFNAIDNSHLFRFLLAFSKNSIV